MQTLSSKLPDTFDLSLNQHIYGLRQVRYPDDLPLLHRWMHTEHVIPQWQLNKPELELHIFFEKMLADDHQRLYLITLDGAPIGYTEVYECARDRLARYYPADNYDMGFHVLLGEQECLGRGHFQPIYLMLGDFILRHNPKSEKVVGEPDVTIPLFRFFAKSLAIEAQCQLQMPEKTATLYFWHREQFYQSPAYNRYFNKPDRKAS